MCLAVNPSDTAPALVALNAKIKTNKGLIDAEGLARKMGQPRSGNMVFLGYAAKQSKIGLDYAKYLEAIERLSPAKFREQNRKGFQAGFNL